jgi:hypothetical protein
MNAMRKISVISIALAVLMVLATQNLRAERYVYRSPLFLPFAVAGAAVGTAGAIVTGVVPGPHYVYTPEERVYYAPEPVYYAPEPVPHGAVWVPGHYDRFGDWVPGHWR